MRIAMTRDVSQKMGQCELTFLDRTDIDIDQARAQHAGYENALEELGCQIIRLPGEVDLPDSVFVEDVAIVLDDVAIIARPGAESRRPEAASVAQAIRAYRELVYIESPGTLDASKYMLAPPAAVIQQGYARWRKSLTGSSTR
jgi:dimethylargininase